MKLKTYVVNLERSTVRKQYMEQLLQPYSFLDVEFIKAVDGRILSEEEINSQFDFNRSRKLYGKRITPGEVGCTLSHRKIYKQIVDDNIPYALLLEDDIAIQRDLNFIDLDAVDKLLRSSKPRVLMLSGDYCYYKKKPIARIYSAVGTYAYMINFAGAKLIYDKVCPCSVADDWLYFKRKGLKMYAIYPYMIDANVNMDVLGSDIQQNSWGIDRSQMSKKEVLIDYITGAIKRLFKRYDHFEYKIRVYKNKVVERKKKPSRKRK